MKKNLPFLALLLANQLNAGQVGTEEAPPPEKVYNPSSRFQVAEGVDVFLTAEVLYWIAREEHLCYAQTDSGGMTNQNPPNGAIDFKGDIKKISAEWDFGVRLGLGYRFPYDKWDLEGAWTYYHTDQHNSISGNLLPLWAHPDTAATNLASFARAKWNFHFNLADLELTRSFWVGRHLSFSPFFGLRGAWIDQNLNIEYDYQTTPFSEGNIHTECDFSGGGVRSGVGTRYTFDSPWSLYGLGSVALLYGKFHCNFKEKLDDNLIALSKDHFNQGVTNLQILLGLRWDEFFWKRRLHVGLTFGWEYNIWLSVNQFNRWATQLNTGTLHQQNGNLTLMGFSVGGQFDF